jgi:hypothetical protein
VLARLARAERIKASAREFDVDRHTVIDESAGPGNGVDRWAAVVTRAVARKTRENQRS